MSNLTLRIVARYIDQVGAGTWKGWEHRKERDDAVERNIEAISPHLKSLWRKMKHQFKGTPQRRLELFLQYVHEHPDEGMELIQDEADRELAKMIKDLERRHWEPATDKAPPRREHVAPHYEPTEDPIPFSG